MHSKTTIKYLFGIVLLFAFLYATLYLSFRPAFMSIDNLYLIIVGLFVSIFGVIASPAYVSMIGILLKPIYLFLDRKR